MITLRTKYFENLLNTFDTAYELMEKKNQGYAKEGDPFENFRNSSLLAGITLEQGILVRMGDKFARFRNLVAKGQTNDEVGEAITDTLLDLINYAAILKTWCDLEKPEAGKTYYDPLNPDPLPLDVAGQSLPEKKTDENWFRKLISKAQSS